VLVVKTKKAIETYDIKTLAIGGGVSANKEIRRAFQELIKNKFPDIQLFIPEQKLTTDNAVMIAVAGYFRLSERKTAKPDDVRADGNLRLL